MADTPSLIRLNLCSRSAARAHAGWGVLTGAWGMLTASLILSFYAIVAGWMISHAVASVADLIGVSSSWLLNDSVTRSLVFAAIFYALTISIIASGVTNGIEKWSRRLMPLLILLIVALIAYIATLNGAMEGLSLIHI